MRLPDFSYFRLRANASFAKLTAKPLHLHYRVSKGLLIIGSFKARLKEVSSATVMRRVILVLVLISLTISVIDATDKDVENDVSDKTESPQEDSGDANVDSEKLDYARGSVCGYCSYCQFCKLCDKDCPCETSHTKPNCRMCKYCKYCYLCSAFCDTVCTPGGILDRVSGAIVNSLPSFNKDEVDDDIDSVKHWIDQKRDEL